MARNERSRIEVNPNQGGINRAFADSLSALDVSGLRPGTEAQASSPDPRPRPRGRAVLRRETAHRGGKAVIVVHGFEDTLGEEEIRELGSRLRKAVGCGGTVAGREIEIQGDQADKVRAFLENEGFRVAGERGR